MNKRILKKNVKSFTIVALDVNLCLQHARPSFFRLTAKEQRRAIARKLKEEFGTPRSQTNRALWKWASIRSSFMFLPPSVRGARVTTFRLSP